MGHFSGPRDGLGSRLGMSREFRRPANRFRPGLDSFLIVIVYDLLTRPRTHPAPGLAGGIGGGLSSIPLPRRAAGRREESLTAARKEDHSRQQATEKVAKRGHRVHSDQIAPGESER